MPLPKPKKDESKEEFMDRCMGDSVMLKEYPNNDQRYAVCESQWDGSKKDKKSDNSELERRVLVFDETELRAEDGDEPKLVGYAAKYGIFTDLGYFREKIKTGAFDEVMDNDVRCLKNHDPNLILGRTKNKTLRLLSNSVGLKFEDDIPATNTGKDTLEEVRRGDISGCSFAFTVAEDDWRYFDDKPAERTIIKIGRLFDVGPVTYPAYEDTTVSARSLEKAKREDGFLSANKIREMEEQNSIPTVSQGEIKSGEQEQKAKKKYECECIECGHTLKTDKHCKDIKCSECGGQMRRKERPGPGQKSKENENTIPAVSQNEAKSGDVEPVVKTISADRHREIMKKYRRAGRELKRIKQAEA